MDFEAVELDAPAGATLLQEQHRPLAEYCRVMLGRLREHYEARARAS
ncbi:hypothetical protein [Streptomyces collinus]|nr:hypothetical protein [Streptomyces collinus]